MCACVRCGGMCLGPCGIESIEQFVSTNETLKRTQKSTQSAKEIQNAL